MIHVPTLLWFGSPWDDIDLVLDGIALTGAGLAMMVLVTGMANMVVMATMWVLYHSLVNVGQAWFSFGWESQLLETGFLAIWCVPVFSVKKMPRKLPPPWVLLVLDGVYHDLLLGVCLGVQMADLQDHAWCRINQS